MNWTHGQIEATVKSKGYRWFDEGNYNLNIVGVRNSDVGNAVTNLFDDRMCLVYKINEVWKYHEWIITTDPGKKGVMEYGNRQGVARLIPGQYPGSHMIGPHKNYEALRQKGLLKVYRDSDRDMVFDGTLYDEGTGFGINIHHAGEDSTYVENWSEGCQVFKRKKDFYTFMEICRSAKNLWGNSFTYTLLESKDITTPR